jgi:hypothetical protein
MIKIPFIKVSATLFALLALLISLFPPFDFLHQGKQYDFIFSGFHNNRKILFGELIVEYILAFLISIILGYLLQRFNVKKLKIFNSKNLLTLIKKRNELNFEEQDETSGLNQKLLNKSTIIGAFHIENGITNFPEWSNIMIDDLGEEIKPYLEEIWEKIKQDYKKLSPEMNDKKILNEYDRCFCSSCLEESSWETMGDLSMFNFIGTGYFEVGYRCNICHSHVAYKCEIFFGFPIKFYGKFRLKALGTNPTFFGSKTTFISRKIKDQTKYKFKLFHW